MNNPISKTYIYTIFLLIIIALPLSVSAQKKNTITIQENSITIKEILSRIEKETEYSVAYNRSKLKLDQTISVSLKNVRLDKALERIFKDTDYEYKIKGYHIIIVYNEKPKEEPEKKVIPPPDVLVVEHDFIKDIHINTHSPILAKTNVMPVEIPPRMVEDMGPYLMIKNNLLHEGLGLSNSVISLNMGAELKLSKRYTLDLLVGYSPSSSGDSKKMEHLLVQPEIRYWLDKSFDKHFIGLHAHWASFNIGNISIPTKLEDRYDGWLAGQGISYGYRWNISSRWALEGTLGLGYAYIQYKQYDYLSDSFKKKSQKHYVGPTRAGITISYTIKQ